MSQALLVIDIQNDYFPEGRYPLWNTDETLTNIESAIVKAQAENIHVILVQHLVHSLTGNAPFFNKDSTGAAIHPRILAAAPNAPVVVKAHADSFVETVLAQTLLTLGVNELFVCGMMTQNCVTHTAISPFAEKYKVAILADCCTSVDAMIHHIALRAVSTRMTLVSMSEAF